MQQVEGQDLQGGGGQRQAGGKYDTEPAGKGVPKRGAQDLLGRGKFRMQEVDGLLGDRGGGSSGGFRVQGPRMASSRGGFGVQGPHMASSSAGFGVQGPHMASSNSGQQEFPA